MANNAVVQFGLAVFQIAGYAVKLVQHFNDPDAPLEFTQWNLSAAREALHNDNTLTTSSGSRRSVFVLGELSEASLLVLELMHEYSPELILLLSALGLLCVGGSISFVIIVFVRFLQRRWRRFWHGNDASALFITPPNSDHHMQISDTARRLFALVHGQNPELFSQPTLSPPRTRQGTRRRQSHS